MRRGGRGGGDGQRVAAQALGQFPALREERGGVAVIAHAQQDDVERPGQGGEGGFDVRLAGIGVRRMRLHRHEARRGGRALQQRFAHQPLIAVGAHRLDPAFVDQSDDQPGPVERHFRQRLQHRARRAAARHGDGRDAARRDGVGQDGGDARRDVAGGLGPGGENMFGRHGHSAVSARVQMSTQVAPVKVASRSGVSSTDAVRDPAAGKTVAKSRSETSQ